MNDRKKTYFVSGIGTDVGKSYATGWLAAQWRAEGANVMTMKFVQTGCSSISEDIALHRRLMGMELLPEDLDGTTCPQCFSYPASPDLAARLEGRRVDLEAVDAAARRLLQRYDTLLIEGAGGLMVPLQGLYTTLDYVAERSLPVILVTNSLLGSVNHTLLSLEACRARNVEVSHLIYNVYSQTSPEITADTRRTLTDYLARFSCGTVFAELSKL